MSIGLLVALMALLGFAISGCSVAGQRDPGSPVDVTRLAGTSGHNPARLRRADSFFGLHFDFHAGDDCTEIGKMLTPEMVDSMLVQVQPDYVQCDSKGHRGLSSYPTKIGNPAPGFVHDPLRIWRDVTARRGVALYVHHSGVCDAEAIRKHPDWARIDEKGKADPDNTSVFGPYVDDLLIPQLQEMCDAYGVDGAWVDGDCWATAADYGDRAVSAFHAATGLADPPRSPDEPDYYTYVAFCREGFRRYLRHYVDALHAHNPRFQITSNWAFSSMMPEPVSAAVDFLSGDYSPQDSVNSARIEGRCLAAQDRPWDLMAWSFAGKLQQGDWTTKSLVQLEQEAAVVLALGGGFQAYFQQNRDASIQPWQVPLMADLARFCRARQSFCHRARPVPQIALLHSSEDQYRRAKKLFAPWSGELSGLKGTLQVLLDSQNSVEILAEHNFADRLRDYPLVIVPQCMYLEDSFREQLLDYVRSGGNLLLIGPATAGLFAEDLGIRCLEEPAHQTRWIEHAGRLAAIKVASQRIECLPHTQPFGHLRPANDLAAPGTPAASIRQLGKGRLAALHFDLGDTYGVAQTAVARDLLVSLVRELFPEPLVEITGSHSVDVTVMRAGSRLSINLVNTAGPHANAKIYTFDELPPIGPLQVTVRITEKPRRITRQPAGEPLQFTYDGSRVSLTLPRLAIHDILVVE